MTTQNSFTLESEIININTIFDDSIENGTNISIFTGESEVMKSGSLKFLSGGDVNIRAKNIEISSGQGRFEPTSNGGQMNLKCGDAKKGSGGGIQMRSGNSETSTAGKMYVSAGNSAAGIGGSLNLIAGEGFNENGNIKITCSDKTTIWPSTLPSVGQKFSVGSKSGNSLFAVFT